MARELQDRSTVLFGRGPDLAYLLGRAGRKGVTAVVGRAQMGKSWLLTELARQLWQDGGSPRSATIQGLNLQERPSYLVGFPDSLGETADLLLRAVEDLYTRWLSDSNYWQQAQVVWQQQRKGLVSKTGQAVGTIFEKLSKLGAKPLEAVGGLVKETFEALVSVNRELLSGGLQLPRLQIEQGRDLLAMVAQITTRPMVLVFDQIELEGNILDSFLRHLDEWPACHIFLGVNPYEKASAGTAVEKLHEDFPGPVEIYELGPMHLDDSASRAALLEHLRGKVSATETVAEEQLLEMISGNPRVVNRWTSPYEAERMHSLRELKEVADDANQYRYREFEVLLKELSDEQRCFGMRLALLPASSSPELWKTLQPLILEGVRVKDLDTLKRNKVLEASAPPSYGHAKRGEAALQWFTKRYEGELREVCESLIFSLGSSLGSSVSDTSPQVILFADALAALQPMALKLKLSSLPQTLCDIALESALDVVEGPITGRETLLIAAEEVKEDKRRAPVAPLIIVGLFRALLNESTTLQKLEWTVWEGDAKQLQEIVHRREVLLNEIRVLADSNRKNADVRQCLVMLLTNLLDKLMIANQFASWSKQLWQLAQDYSQDEGVRRSLADFLFRTLDDAWLGHYANQEQSNEQEILKRGHELLEQLRLLRHDYPGDAVVREKLAWSLANTLGYAKHETSTSSDAVLAELRKLADDSPQDAEVRKQLAMGLFNTLINTEQTEFLQRSDVLLGELRQLAGRYSEDAAVREWLAKGLSNTLVYARQQGASERSDTLLEELRQLTQDNREDTTVRELLAQSLFNTTVLAMLEKAFEGINKSLKALSQLAREYRDDVAVRKYLASGLYHGMIHAEQEGAPKQHDAWLEELRQLVRSYPEDETMIKIAPLLDLGGKK